MQRDPQPLIVLHRIPTAGELEFLRHYIIQYKADHPAASNQELRVAAQKKFDSKIIWKSLSKGNARAEILNLNNKAG